MKPSPQPIKLIVGLGNPGSDYHHTRHNAGQDLVAELATQYNATLKPNPKFFGLEGRAIINGHDLRLLIPTTFMNRSGQSVSALAQFYKIEPASVLVTHDELDLDPGVARFKIGGGHGGHNGLRDIISALGNNTNFARCRIGIGHPGNAKQVASFVLKKASNNEAEKIELASGEALKQIPNLLNGDWEKAMRELHRQRF